LVFLNDGLGPFQIV